MRVSPGPRPVQNGCRLTSSRPASKSNPTAAAALAGELFLAGGGIAPFENLQRRLARESRDPPDKLDQRPAKLLENLPHACGRLARLEFIEQRVVRIARSESDARRLLPLEVERLFQPRLEHRVIVLRPRLAPRLLAEDGGLRQFLDKRGRQLGRAVIGPARLAHVHGRIGIGIAHKLRRLNCRKQLPNARRRQPLMHHLRQQRRLPRPLLRPLRRHLRPLVPTEHARHRSEQCDLAEFVD